MKVIIALLCFVWVVAEAQTKLPPPPKSESYPAGTLDSRGLVPWGIGKPLNPLQEKGLRLLKTRNYSEATRFFRIELQRNPTDLLLAQGLIASHAKSGSLNECVEYFNEAIRKYPKKAVGHQIPQTTAPVGLQLGLFYSVGIRHYYAESGSNPDPKLRAAIRKGSPFWFEPVNRQLGLRPKDRVFSMMYIQALDGLNRRGESRIAAEEMLRSDPKFYQLRLIYSSMLLSGVLKMSDSSGNELPVPAIERKDPSKALKMAEIVIRDEPTSPLGYYFAAVAASHVDKVKAKRYLSKFLQIAPTNDPRRPWALWRIQFLS